MNLACLLWTFINGRKTYLVVHTDDIDGAAQDPRDGAAIIDALDKRFGVTVDTSFALLDDGYVWAWGGSHGLSPTRVDAYGVGTTMRLQQAFWGFNTYGQGGGDELIIVLADGTVTRNGVAVAEFGSGIVQIARGLASRYSWYSEDLLDHTLVLRGE